MAMQDTSSEQSARYHQLLREMTPQKRLSAGVRALALCGLRQRHPQASEAELRVRLTVRLYGRACAERLFGDIPKDAD